MKKIVAVSFFLIFSYVLFSQKVTIQIAKSDQTALSEWSILDANYGNIISGNDFFNNDSLYFSLDANRRYFLHIRIFEIHKKDSTLYTLSINNEPIILISSSVGTGDHYYPFFTGTKAVQGKIRGGTDASIADFPWQVYYISGNFRCGGSIISPDWILTAAHCTKDDSGNAIPIDQMSVVVGASNPADGQTYNIKNVIVNSGYNDQTLINDIALLNVETPINNPNAHPIKIITSEEVSYGSIDPGVLAWVSGWGLTNVSPNVLPLNLQKVQLPIITLAQAATVWGSSIPSTDIMAGYLNGNKDACNGDSGGPMSVPVVDGFKLAGIVSWGSSNCNTYGAYTNVSLFENWIQTNTGIPKDFFPPTPVGDTIICSGTLSSTYSISDVPGATAYEWRILPANAGTISGSSTSATVTWTPGYFGGAAVIVRVTVGAVVSEWSRLNLQHVHNTRLIKQSADTVICEKQPVTLTVEAEGYHLIYNWFRDGILAQTGTSPQFFLSSTVPAESGVYTVQIVGACGTVTSENINLTIHELTNITSISPSMDVPFGSTVTLTVFSQGFDLVYQWEKDSIPLQNTDNPKLVLQNVNASNIGLYRVKVSGACGTQISDSVYVFVREQNFSGEPDVFLWPSVTIDEFNVALSNNSTYSISIYNTRGQIIRDIKNCQYQTPVNVSSLASGEYIVKVFNNTFHKIKRFIKQ